MVSRCRTFTDKEFPPDDKSLGRAGRDSANAAAGKSSANVVWLRASRFATPGKVPLFGDTANGETISGRDICQGALGSCWLLAAMACLAEHRGAMGSVFRLRERNPCGKYRLRLCDGVTEKWENIVIDDFIPCDKAAYQKDGTCRPIFARPGGNELYALLLEKAFAKFCGSYAETEGGQTIWAIRAMTGGPARWFMQEGDRNGWKRFDLLNLENPQNRRATSLKPRGETLDNETMFEVLRKYHSLKSVLCAAGSSGVGGLHTGRACSILDVRKVGPGTAGGIFGIGETFRLVRIRNPWGVGEWKGDWSDRSALWDKHPAVKKAVSFSDQDDGAFWMSWDDYVRHWSKIGIVDRTVDAASPRLRAEHGSACAPVGGRCAGRRRCCRRGPSRSYSPHRGPDETAKAREQGCAIL